MIQPQPLDETVSQTKEYYSLLKQNKSYHMHADSCQALIVSNAYLPHQTFWIS